MNLLRIAAGAALLAVCGAGPRSPAGPAPARPEPEAVSLLGEKLYAPDIPPERRRELEAQLAQARAAAEARPDNPDELIWFGRRTAYLGRYREAIAIFTRGVEKFPSDPRFYRHRGHRYITTRKLAQAVADLEKAASLVEGKADEVEPDGLPNARNIPTSTTNSNIWYHLGLARYLQGDFEKALAAYRKCLTFSKNPDGLVSTGHWLYMTLRRLGRAGEAERFLATIPDPLDVIENHEYERLVRMYQGRIAPAVLLSEAQKGGSTVVFTTVGYGVGNWDLYNGREAQAMALFRRIVESGEWVAFGEIAAEADLARSGSPKESSEPTRFAAARD